MLLRIEQSRYTRTRVRTQDGSRSEYSSNNASQTSAARDHSQAIASIVGQAPSALLEASV